jgi:hypothetical protein
MNYSEAAYFDGAYVAHIAAWQDHRRVLALFSRAEAIAIRCALSDHQIVRFAVLSVGTRAGSGSSGVMPF